MSFNAFNVVLKSQYVSHLCIVNGNKGDASGQRLAQLMFLEYVHGIIFDVAQAASRSFLTRVHTLFLLSVFFKLWDENKHVLQILCTNYTPKKGIVRKQH
jgi:hypothetical protein